MRKERIANAGTSREPQEGFQRSGAGGIISYFKRLLQLAAGSASLVPAEKPTDRCFVPESEEMRIALDQGNA